MKVWETSFAPELPRRTGSFSGKRGHSTATFRCRGTYGCRVVPGGDRRAALPTIAGLLLTICGVRYGSRHERRAPHLRIESGEAVTPRHCGECGRDIVTVLSSVLSSRCLYLDPPFLFRKSKIGTSSILRLAGPFIGRTNCHSKYCSSRLKIVHSSASIRGLKHDSLDRTGCDVRGFRSPRRSKH